MELYFKRFFWIIPIVVVMLCSLIAAQAANHILTAVVLAPPAKGKPKVQAARQPKAPAEELAAMHSKDDAIVASRNLFCSSCEPAVAKPADAAAPAPTSSGIPLTALPVVLVATLVASDPTLSTATIVNSQSFRTGSYRVDDVIPAVGKVMKVRSKYVDFENLNSGRLERVELAPSVQVASAAPPPPPPPTPLANPTGPPPGNPEGELLAEIDKGVKKVDDTHYELDRALVEKMLNDPSLLSRAARIVPSIQGGKNNGFKLYAIRPNSPFSKLGLQNGDTIQVVNGFEVTGFDKALEVLGKVRSASSVSLQILRRGQPVTMEYNIK
jgi:general secretion pathway protein C